MSTISRKTKTLIVGIGVAALAGVLLALGPAWLAHVRDGAPAGTIDETSATDASDPSTWPLPAHESRDRTNRPLLELVGVHVGIGEATAMIRVKDGTTYIYRVGDQVVDNRELVEIHETHVLLRNEDRIERLRITGRNPRQHPDREELEEFADRLTIRSDDSEQPPPE